ncbi:MAG: hypothetical protein R3F61_24470 [Myxococcota bacterium]
MEINLKAGETGAFAVTIDAAAVGGIIDASGSGRKFDYRIAAGGFYDENAPNGHSSTEFMGYCSTGGPFDPPLANAWESTSECVLPSDDVSIAEGFGEELHPYDVVSGGFTACSGLNTQVKAHFRSYLEPSTTDFTDRVVQEDELLAGVTGVDTCYEHVMAKAPAAWRAEFTKFCSKYTSISAAGFLGGLHVTRGTKPHSSLGGPSGSHNYYGSRPADSHVFDYFGRPPMCVDYIFKTMVLTGKTNCSATFNQTMLINCGPVVPSQPTPYAIVEHHNFSEEMRIDAGKQIIRSRRDGVVTEVGFNSPDPYQNCPDPTPLH